MAMCRLDRSGVAGLIELIGESLATIQPDHILRDGGKAAESMSTCRWLALCPKVSIEDYLPLA